MTPLTYTKTQSNLTWQVTFDWEESYLSATTTLSDDRTLIVFGHTMDQGASGEWMGSMIYPDGARGNMGYCDGTPLYLEALDFFADKALPKPKPVEKPKTGLERMMGLFGGGK